MAERRAASTRREGPRSHDPKALEAMPNFNIRSTPAFQKITSGGWAKESTLHQTAGEQRDRRRSNVPQSRRIARTALARHSGRMGFIIDGRCQTMVRSTLQGASEINNYEPGDLCTSQRPRSFDPRHRRQACHFIHVVR